MPHTRPPAISFLSGSHAAWWGIITLGVALLAVLSMLGQPFVDWKDAAAYQATATFMAQHGSFLPQPVGYLEYLANPSLFGQQVFDHPNYGFELLLAAVSLFRQDFSLMNGIIVSLSFSWAFGLAVYGMGYTLTRDRIIAGVLSLGLICQYTIAPMLARPLTDTSLFLFFALALWAVLEQKHVLAGLALGAGYLFREHALLFVPFFPFLSPAATNIRGTVVCSLKIFVAFMPFLAIAQGISAAFTYGEQQPGFYTAYAVEQARFWLSAEAWGIFARLAVTSLRHLNWVLVFFMAAVLIKPGRFPRRVHRLCLVALALFLIPCLTGSTIQRVPARYLAYSGILLVTALALAAGHKERGRRWFIALIVLTIFVHLPPTVNLKGARRLAHMPTSWTRYYEEVMTPTLLATCFSPGAVILSDSDFFPFLMDSSVTVVQRPDYATFRDGVGNEGIDGLIFIGKPPQWPDVDVYTDTHGVRFQRVYFPSGTPSPFRHRYFKRVPQ